MSSSLLLLPAPRMIDCTARRGAIRRSRAGRCLASADTPNEKVYVGKGKYIDAKPEGMPGRDPGGFTGGWAGGEKGLKEGSWAAGWKEGEDPAQAPPSAQAAPEAAQGTGKDTIYVGKGRFVRDDASRYPDKELGGLTGGWAGGEVGLKTNVDLFPVNTRVKVKGDPPAAWMQNALFANSAMALATRTGVVTSVRLEGGRLKIGVRLDADASAGFKVVIFNEGDIEKVAA